MRNLNYELKQLCRRNRDGSFATQRDRERVLDLVASQLHEMGYRHMAAASLKPKHVESLVERSTGSSFLPSFLNTITGIHSPTRIKSSKPFPS